MAAIALRAASVADRPYILSCMRRTLIDSSAYMRNLHPRVVDDLLEPMITWSSCAIACTKTDTSTILGFVMWRHDSVSFIYVRAPLRRTGIARRLLEHAEIVPGEINCPFLVTKWDGQGGFASWAQSKGYTLRYRPYMPLELHAEAVCPPPGE